MQFFSPIWSRSHDYLPYYILVIIITMLIFPMFISSSYDQKNKNESFNDDYLLTTYLNNIELKTCMSDCKISLVESISMNMTYPKDAVIHPSIYDTWLNLINLARNTIEIATLHLQLNHGDNDPADHPKHGEDVFQALYKAGRKRGIPLRIVHDVPNHRRPSLDSRVLEEKVNAKVHRLNFTSLLGAGALHTKLWLIDRTHFYIGSANMDWRALVYGNELGIVGYNCSCMANDLAKIFDVYWTMGETKKIPKSWSQSLATKINLENPMNFSIEGNEYKTYFASAPPKLSPDGRTGDLDALLNCINKAEKFIYVAVRSYIPMTRYTSKMKYWPIIDDAIKAAAIDRKVQVKILISKRMNAWKSEDYFLKALMDLSGSFDNVSIQVKKMAIPNTPEFENLVRLDHVYHNKFMVTDIGAYIGTSNWLGDYFIDSAGIAMLFEDVIIRKNNKNSIRQQLENLFNRDWNSHYAYPLNTSSSRSKASSGLFARSQTEPRSRLVQYIM